MPPINTRSRSRTGSGWIPAVIILLVLAAIAGIGWKLYFQKPAIETTRVERKPIVRAFYATGVVRPDYEYVLKSRAQGAIIGLAKRENARVYKGEVLARIDDRQLQFEAAKFQAQLAEAKKQATEDSPERMETVAKLNEAKAQLEISQRTLDRTQQSFDKQAATVSDLDVARRSHVQWANNIAMLESQLGTWKIESQRRVDVAEAELRKAQANLKDADVIAPIDGVILEHYVENQEVVGINQKLLLIADPDDLLMKAAVDEEDITRTHLGQKVQMQLYAFQDRDHSGKPTVFEGKVVEMLPSANPANKTYEVKVKFIDPPMENSEMNGKHLALRTGMTAELNFIEEESRKDASLVVPSSAVLDRKVYKHTNAGHYEPVDVEIGIRTLDAVEITSGLAEGDEIVRDAKQVAPVKLPPQKQPVVPTRTGDQTAEK